MKVVVFGTGKIYKKYSYKLLGMQIVAFLDNDVEKQGKILDNAEIISPQSINTVHYDYVVLMSCYYKEMRHQLLELGVEESRILDREHKGHFAGITSRHCYDVMERSEGKKRVALISHELSLTGAPIILHTMAKLLKKNGYWVEYISKRDGELKFEIMRSEITLNIFEDYSFSENEVRHYFEKYDIIIINTVTLYNLVDRLQILGKPIVWWLHEGITSYQRYNICQNDLRPRDNVYIYGVSNKVIQEFCMNAKHELIKRLMYGIENKDCIIKRRTRSNQKIIFAVIGNVSDRKGQDIFVDVVNSNWEDWKSIAEFWIVGSITDDKRREFEKYKTVRIMGMKEHTELLEMYGKMDVIVCPSRDDPLPIVVVEGMMKHKPCIVSDMTGTSEFIIPMENGLICKTGSRQSLRESIQWFLGHKENLENMGDCAYQTYEREFTLEKFENRILKLIDGLGKSDE